MPDLDWTIFILCKHSILFCVFGDASLDSLDNLETLGVDHHQIFRVVEVEQLVSFHHRVVILQVTVVLINWQSKFAYKFGLIDAIFDVNFEHSGLGVFITIGIRGLDNDD